MRQSTTHTECPRSAAKGPPGAFLRTENPAAWEQERVRCGGAEEDDGGSLQGGIAEAVDEGVDALARLAQGAVTGIEAGVVGQVGRVEDGRDRDAQAVGGGGEDGRQACDRAAVVVDSLDGSLCGVAGGDGSRQDEHMLALDHGGQIVAQDDLAAGGVLRRDDIDGLVGVHVGEAVFRELVGQAGADDLGAVQAEDGIHDGAMLIGSHQLLCHGLGLGQTGFLGGHVDVIVDMAVAGGKMPLCHAQEQTALIGG